MLQIIRILTDEVGDLYKKYRKMTYTTALSTVRNQDLADEIVQDSLEKLLLNRKKMKDVDCIDTRNFVYTVTKNTALTARKRRNSLAAHVQSDASSGILSLERVALRKLDMLNAAYYLETLKIPPGNRLVICYPQVGH